MTKEKEALSRADLRAALYEALLHILIPNEDDRVKFLFDHKEEAIEISKSLIEKRFKSTEETK